MVQRDMVRHYITIFPELSVQKTFNSHVLLSQQIPCLDNRRVAGTWTGEVNAAKLSFIAGIRLSFAWCNRRL